MARKSHIERVETDQADHNIQVYIDVSSGDFTAEHGEIGFKADSVVEMRNMLRKQLKEIDAVEYKPYLAIESGDYAWNGRDGVKLTFEAILLSDVVESRKHRLQKVLNYDIDTGEIHGEWKSAPRRYNDIDTKLVPYTPERYRTLVAIQNALEKLEEQIKGITQEGKADEIGERLDGLQLKRLTAFAGSDDD